MLTLSHLLGSGGDSDSDSDDDSVENDRNSDKDRRGNADNNQAFLSGIMMLSSSIFLYSLLLLSMN